ncbi:MULTISPECIES: N-glycosylase/DNA lyase [Thermococcus]|uniref:N-glycosylase/DNA lyase n=1 Tax=Thermococcus sibiricus (strain DSM 12597 / MM 739) TaxID=604354 RepID=C5ZZX2_THESM|nr:N-glycosylase/DNA lyase (AGOG) (8-oxoguanine DNA glycosylase) [Thermococcus sibiricus MM 739]
MVRKLKVEFLKSILKELGIECARTIEEKVDLQFSALESLHKNLNDDELFLKLVIANSIVSYQLSGKGENWWWEFSNYFSKKPPIESIVKAYSEFLPRSKSNKRLIQLKLNRLKKLEPFLNSLAIEDLRKYYQNMLRFRDRLAKVMNAKEDAKTIVFAVKMFGYASRIAFGDFIPYPMEIDIPKDFRIENYTRRFTDRNSTTFWREVSKEVGIPPLHIDSILWPVLGRDTRVAERLKEHCEKYELVLELVSL